MNPLLIYCYDAYCGWCYGFSKIIARIDKEYRDRLEFEVLSGGMILPDKPVHITATAAYIRSAYKIVEERTGTKFGEDYLWHIFNPDQSDWYPHSEKAAIASCIFKEYYLNKQIEFANDLQFALHYEGRDLTDNEAYRHLLEKYNINTDEFYQKLNDLIYKEKAYNDFATVKRLKVTGFPTVFIQMEEGKFYLIARGYTEYEKLKNSIDKILTA